MSSAEEAVVSAHGWILGITYSILASIVGGASKLSIRKSCEFLFSRAPSSIEVDPLHAMGIRISVLFCTAGYLQWVYFAMDIILCLDGLVCMSA